MAHIIQVGAGSGGFPVLDMLARDPRITRVTLVEPDLYRPHNVERHLFSNDSVGELKAVLAERWLKERRPDLEIQTLAVDLMAPEAQGQIEAVASEADIGVCAADNEPAKLHWDALMRRLGKPWTLGEVLAGGIGGFVHWFVPGGPCYGCVASHLKRAIEVEKPQAPDYSNPNGVVGETTVPADIASIHAIASLHALVTLGLLASPNSFDPGFTSLLVSLRPVPEIFPEVFRPYRFRIPRSADCLFCRPGAMAEHSSSEELDDALHQALARLGNE